MEKLYFLCLKKKKRKGAREGGREGTQIDLAARGWPRQMNAWWGGVDTVLLLLLLLRGFCFFASCGISACPFFSPVSRARSVGWSVDCFYLCAFVG